MGGLMEGDGGKKKWGGGGCPRLCCYSSGPLVVPYTSFRVNNSALSWLVFSARLVWLFDFVWQLARWQFSLRFLLYPGAVALFVWGSGDLSAFAATGLLRHLTVLYRHYD